MKKHKNLLLSLITLSILTACGGESSNNNTDISTPDPEPTKSIGVFIDSPIINIGYRTETLEGVTNESGEYEYLPDETVTFFIGDLELPTVTGKEVITPLELAESSFVNDAKVVNIIRLLQTLDQDGDPNNGLTITDTAKTTAYTSTDIDFSLSEIDFENLSSIDALIRDAGLDNPVEELVTTADAIAHFQKELDAAQIENKLQVFTSELLEGKTLYSIYYEENENICIAEQGYMADTVSFKVWSYNSDGSWNAGCPFDEAESYETPYVINEEGKIVWTEAEWWFVLNSYNNEQYTVTDPDGTYLMYLSKDGINSMLSKD